MSGDFLQSLDLDEKVYSAGNLIVVHENGRADGGFVEHFIVADFLRRFGRDKDTRVVLVLTHHSEVHWQSIAGKVGWNFNIFKEKGQLVTIDLVKETYKSLISASGSNLPEPESGLVNKSGGSIDLEKLFTKIRDFLSSSGHSGDSTGKVKRLIVIEDLSRLLYQESLSLEPNNQNCSTGERDAIEFMWKLRNLAEPGQTSVLTLVNSSGGGDDSGGDAVGTRFAKLVAQVLAQVTIQVSPLSTGFSPQISGYLTTRTKINGENKWVKSNHYKLEDRNIRVTPLA